MFSEADLRRWAYAYLKTGDTQAAARAVAPNTPQLWPQIIAALEFNIEADRIGAEYRATLGDDHFMPSKLSVALRLNRIADTAFVDETKIKALAEVAKLGGYYPTPNAKPERDGDDARDISVIAVERFPTEDDWQKASRDQMKKLGVRH